MIGASIGSLIAVLATSALVLTVTTIEKLYRNAGRYPLKTEEIELLINADLNNDQNINIIKTSLESLPQNY